LSTKYVSQSLVNSNDTPDQRVLQCEDIPRSDNTSNSDNTPNLSSEHNLPQSKETMSQLSKLSDVIGHASSADDDSSETLDFVERVGKERVSNIMKERNQEKKPQVQNLSSDNNSSCDIKTVSRENDYDN